MIFKLSLLFLEMRILAVGDFQGVFPERLRSKLRREKFDLVVGVGDYAGIKEWRAWVMADLASVKKGNGRISPEEYFGKEKFKLILKKDFEAGKSVKKYGWSWKARRICFWEWR